jgi:2-octaprenyl-6-methoxyphenol hydroxylase
MLYDYDLLIGGGGLAGNCLALALKDCGLKIAIIEAVSREQLQNSPAGDRALALAAGTVALLDDLGAWQQAKKHAAAIEHIHVSDKGHFGKTRLSAKQQGVEALGYVITARDIESHVAQLVADAGITQICPARIIGLSTSSEAVHVSLHSDQDLPDFKNEDGLNLTARLLVGADGGESTIRKLLEIAQHRTDYGQTALVTTVKTYLPHQNTAYERFTEFGPLAVLPLKKHLASVVWTRSHEQAADLMAYGEKEFMAQLQECFGYRLGELTLAAPRRAFPLTLIRAEQMLAQRTVIIGNAVHQLHPVAGQGFNLGLRDVVQLAQMLKTQQQQGGDIGADEFLQNYAKLRLKDHDRVIHLTDSLVKIFSTPTLSIAAARNLGLTLLDHIPAAKNLLARQAMGLMANLPIPNVES